MHKVIEKGKTIYYQIKPKLEETYSPGYYVAIDVDTSEYFTGQTAMEALTKAHKKYPRKQFFLTQVGRLAGLLK